jgi:hypothetical protein
MKQIPNVEQMQALVDFAKQYGRTWKSELRFAWETGIYPSNCNAPALQQVRNVYGPTWLVNFRIGAK